MSTAEIHTIVRRYRQHCLWVLVVLLLAPAQHLLAQEDDDGESAGALEEILITARRFEGDISDEPLSVATLDDEYMRAQGIFTVKSAVEFTPSVTYIRFNKMQPEYSMRGVSSPSEGSAHDSSVVTVIDDVPVTKEFLKNPAFFDVERVEVLRGPQGTSFGRNASAGLVHIISKRPTAEFEAGTTAGVGSHGLLEFDAFVSGPVSESVNGRLAAHHNSHDGYTESALTGEGLDGEENNSVRGSLIFTPSDRLSVYFKFEASQDRDDGPIRRSRDCTKPQLATQRPGPPALHPTFPAPFTSFEPFTDSCDVWKTEKTTQFDPGTELFLNRDIISVSTNVVYNITDDVTLTSVTGYQDGDSEYFIDAHGTPSAILFQNTSNDASTFSEEIRFDNLASGNRLTWLTGIYYMQDEHFRDDENRFYDPVGQPGPLDGKVLTLDTKVSNSETESIGLFAELNYDFTEKLTGTFGIRYSKDDRDFWISHTARGWAPKAAGFVFDSAGTCVFPGPPTFNRVGCGELIGWGTPDAPNPNRAVISDDWDNVSIKLALDYTVSDNSRVYAAYSEGYKTGGFQPEPFTFEDALVPFNEEESANYEIGYRGMLADNRLQLNITGFFLDYSDLQVTQFINRGDSFTALIDNAGNVETFGLEFDVAFQLTEGLMLRGTYAKLDAEFVDTFLVDGDGNVSDFSGQRPDNSPEWTATFAAEYTLNLSDGSRLMFRGDYRGRSDVFDDTGELAIRLRPGVEVFGARISWFSANADWEVSLWGRNLGEEEQVLSISPFQPDTLQLPTGFDQPRTYGLSASYYWN